MYNKIQMEKGTQYSGRPLGISKKYKELLYVGSKFDSWEIISDELITNSYNKKSIECQCKCGVKKHVNIYSLINKESTGCSKCSHKRGQESKNYKGYKEIPLKWFSRYTRRDREFNIKIEGVYDLWVKQNKKCKLSGLPLDFENKSTNPKNYRCDISLDRIDSSKGYITGNIQLIHKDINRMKSDFDENYFIKMCELITKNK